MAGLSAQALADAYSGTGPAWQSGPGRVYDRLAEALVDITPVPLATRTVVDLGAGTGAASRAIAAAGGHPVAVDLALGMLRAIGPTRPPCVVSDARALPLADRSVGGVVAAFSLNHVADPHRALAEAARVVAPGGPVLASAYADDDAHPVKAAVDAAAAEQGWVAEPWVAELRASILPILSSVDGARAAAAGAGLGMVRITKVDVPFPHLEPSDLVAWRCGMAQLAPFVAALDDRGRHRLHERALELLGDAPPLVRRVITIAAVT
jgi:SAM-dependent methyltransferase